MKKRLLFAFGLLALLVLATLVIWQGSLDFGNYQPESSTQVYLLWVVSTLVVLLTITLSFMLGRAGVKLYIERQQGAEGSRIRTKLVVGALALAILPAIFVVGFDIQILNRTLDKWFAKPSFEVKEELVKIGLSLNKEAQSRIDAQARWIAMRAKADDFKIANCQELGVDRVWIKAAAGRTGDFELCPGPQPVRGTLTGVSALGDGRTVVVEDRMSIDLVKIERNIQKSLAVYEDHRRGQQDLRKAYVGLLTLITLFLLFVATWLGLFMARQISVPISALLSGVREVRAGNLGYRVSTKAIDELATLVRAFNEMTQSLEISERELERRRRFAEAILENVPAGVVSMAPDGRILRTNRALAAIFPGRNPDGCLQLEDLLPTEDAAEIRYLMKRARRTGLASRQLEVRTPGSDAARHLSVIVTSLEGKGDSGFVLVIEDTSELLRAQKTAAWNEVARRIAHELKNPLTPIALSAERVRRLVDRGATGPDADRIFRECADTIAREVETVRTLVDEFSQFSRFPAAQLRPGDLNEAVESGLAVFQGRLDGITLEKDLARDLPAVNLDPEQVKRVIVNLVDNAAEAMHDQPLRRLYISTQSPSPETVELVVADTGSGIRPGDREKLFLPYFSTKERGTGLGLAIVNHVLGDHQASIRVEDNRPCGARFIVEFPAWASEVTLAPEGAANVA
jgi:two-component system, NtrC family, nitrogen regulation sensor histidine kinase NtrY